MLQCGAVCCSVWVASLQGKTVHNTCVLVDGRDMCMLQCVVVCCSVLQRVAACCSVSVASRDVAACCCVLLCVAVCHSVLQ